MAQLSLGVVPAAEDVVPVCQAQRVAGSGCHHDDPLGQQRGNDARRVLVLGGSQAQLTLRAKPAHIHMALVGQYDRVLPSQGNLGHLGLVSQAGGKVVLQLC